MRAIRPHLSCRSLAVVVIIACATAIAACGSAGGAPSRSGSGGGSFLAYAECMRSNGVPNFPDPGGGGGGIELDGTNLNPASPAFKAAQVICKQKLPGGGPPSANPAETASRKAQLLAIAECMRAHGVSNFPDPTTVRPTSVAGYAIVEDDAGVVLAVPSSVGVSTSLFTRAAKACRFN